MPGTVRGTKDRRVDKACVVPAAVELTVSKRREKKLNKRVSVC